MAEADSRIEAIVSDFGGVLTTPLLGSFMAFQNETGISTENLGKAMQAVAEADGENPLFVLERGEITEAAFLEKLSEALEPLLGHRPHMHRFKEIYFEALDPNPPMIELMRELKAEGYRMAMLTNNVREWEPLWRPMLPVDEIFETVVDSAFVGCRKPEPRIYEMTLERIGMPAESCLFIDDLAPNCEGARAVGLSAVHFRDNEQAIAEVRAALAQPALVVGAGPVPDVELDRLDGEFHQARWRQQAEDQLQGVLLGDAGVHRLLAAEARGQLHRLAAVLAEGAEGSHQEVAVGDRLADLERAVPGGEHREVVLVELGERLRVVRLQLVVGDLVDPGPHRLAEQLPAGLAADRVGDRPDRVSWVYETESHRLR